MQVMGMKITVCVGVSAIVLAIAGPPSLLMTGQLRHSTVRESNAVKGIAQPDNSFGTPVESKKPGCTSNGTLIQYSIPEGKAKEIAKAFRHIFQDRIGFSITAVDSNSILVYGGPSDHREIEYLLRQQFP
jgi:hypothetical protein